MRLVRDKNPLVNASQIRVRTRNAVVTLEEEVVTDQEKAIAESDAWYVFGVDQVNNALMVHRAAAPE